MSEAGATEHEWTPERSVAGGRNPWTIVGVISIATFMVVLDTSIANVALAHIAGGLSASYDEATWIVTSFLVANAIIIPVSGWLADVIGRKRYYMLSVALFTGASILCGLSTSLGMLVVARTLQGIGGGGLTPVEQSMIVDTFAPEQRGLAFALYGIVVIVAPIFGPTLGGFITDTWSWHWVFFINGPVGILSLVLVYYYVDEPEILRRRAKELRGRGFNIDYIGFALVALFLGCLEITLDRGQHDDWFASPIITTCAVIAALSFLFLIPWELTREDPILKIRMYGRRNFGFSTLLLLVLGVIVFGSTQFIPQLLQEVLGYSAEQAGLALTEGGIATLIVMPIAGVLSSRVDLRILVGLAFIVEGLAFWNLSQLSTQMSFTDAALARMFQAVGLPFLFVPITNIAYIGLKPNESNQASALMSMSRNLGGTIGISTVQTLLARREQFHQSRFVEGMNPLNPNFREGVDKLTQALKSHGVPPAEAHRMALARIFEQVQRQASMMSYVEIFHILMIVVFCSVPLIFLMRSRAQ